MVKKKGDKRTSRRYLTRKSKWLIFAGIVVVLLAVATATVIAIKPWAPKVEEIVADVKEETDAGEIEPKDEVKNEDKEPAEREPTVVYPSDDNDGPGAYPSAPIEPAKTLNCDGRSEGPRVLMTVHFVSDEEREFGTKRRGWPYNTVALYSHAMVFNGNSLAMGYVDGKCVPLPSSANLTKAMDQPETEGHLRNDMQITGNTDLVKWYYSDGTVETVMMDDSRKIWEW